MDRYGHMGAQLRLHVPDENLAGDVYTAEACVTDGLEDSRAAGAASSKVYRRFLEEDNRLDLFGYVLDGKVRSERSTIDNQAFSKLVDCVRSTKPDDPDNAYAPSFRPFKVQKDTFVERPIKSLTCDGGEAVLVYLDQDLGFRETLLAAHLAYADFVYVTAQRLGIATCDGDVPCKLSYVVEHNQYPETDDFKEWPSVNYVIIDGFRQKGIVRF